MRGDVRGMSTATFGTVVRLLLALVSCGLAASLPGCAGGNVPNTLAPTRPTAPPVSFPFVQGFNYMHETWREAWAVDPARAVLPQTSAQRKDDFLLMRSLGASAVRLHGANHQWVTDAIHEAHEADLAVWLSYRPNLADLGFGLKSSDHPSLPSKGFCADRESVRALRQAFLQQFREFVLNVVPALDGSRGDCLVVANELPIDLGYWYDREYGYAYSSDFPDEATLVDALVDFAREEGWGGRLTYATYGDPEEIRDLHWGKLDFASLNYYYWGGPAPNHLRTFSSVSRRKWPWPSPSVGLLPPTPRPSVW